MVVELRQVRYLAAIVDQGGFTRAAEALHLSQPALSQQIRKLETSLGVLLLDRSARRVRLTDAGEAFLHRGRLALHELTAAERAVSDVQDLSRGELRIGVTPTFADGAIGDPLSAFIDHAPGVSVSMQVGPQAVLEELLLGDRLDIALGFADVSGVGVSVTRLHPEGLHVVVREDRGGPADVTDHDWFAAQCFALLPSSFATRLHVDRFFADQRISARVRLESDSVGMLADVVRRTDMTTVLPEHAVAAQPGIRSVAWITGRTVAVLTREGAYESAAAVAFRRVLELWSLRRSETALPPIDGVL
ncbi:transcriptional regulator CynR [Curtobacterium citreum]|uniref:transcriptional regulator CynR n=1 Tax=Curtobacterium citreum TaxID=2036 RepID=UPI00254EF8F2|nr:transcriptional regulator CynR [Curtobacterium citreum]MDK8172272.1 transcriptional regulator CynR [Curtobacterium citreum]